MISEITPPQKSHQYRVKYLNPINNINVLTRQTVSFNYDMVTSIGNIVFELPQDSNEMLTQLRKFIRTCDTSIIVEFINHTGIQSYVKFKNLNFTKCLLAVNYCETEICYVDAQFTFQTMITD